MRNKKKISAIVLAGTMMLSMGTNVLAADNLPAVDDQGKASITKDFVMAEGIATPDAAFNFTVIPTTPDAPAATIDRLVFSNADQGILADGITTVEKTSNITFGTFPHAGEYVYTVAETQDTVNGVEYSTDFYTLRVYVKNSANGVEIQNMTAEKNTADGTADHKVSEMTFTNTYRKNAALEIAKMTTGDLADKTKDFDFTITITPSKTEADPDSYTGKIGNKTVNVKANTATPFQLHDGETLKFDSLPAGTRYVVTESGAEDGYTPSVEVVENGVNKGKQTAANETDGISSANGTTNLVGEKANKVTFTNDYKDVPITGMIMNNLPFVIVIGIAVLALGTLAMLKKQRRAGR